MVAVAPLSPNMNRHQRRAAAAGAPVRALPAPQRQPPQSQQRAAAVSNAYQALAQQPQQQSQIWTPQQHQAAQARQSMPQNFYQAWQQQTPPALAQWQAQQAQQGGATLPRYAQPIQHFASRLDEQVYDPSGSYNPHAFGGEQMRAGIAAAVPNPRERMFNAQRQINAYDRKDALTQINHLIKDSARMAHEARRQRVAAQANDHERREILRAAARDTEGFAILGQELLLPIKDLIPYEAIGRKVYRVRPLAQGEFWRVAKDVRASAWVIGQDGQGIESRLHGKYVQPPEYKIGSFPTVDMDDIYQMNYDVLDRAQETAREEIALEEDKRGIAALDVASTTVNAATTFATLGVGAFEDVRFQVERHRLVVEKFLINRQELSDVIKTMSSQVDPVTERELILAGYIGAFLNAMIITTAGTSANGQSTVPAGTFYAVTGPETFGEMGIRTELFSEPFNMFAQFRFVKGWAFGELIGHVVVNPRACAKGVK